MLVNREQHAAKTRKHNPKANEVNQVDPLRGKVTPPETKGKSDEVVRRHLMITDFGAYLKQLRIDKNIAIEDVAADIGYAVQTIIAIEKSRRQPPSEHRLRIWLAALGQSKKLPEALRLLRSVKRSRRVVYHINDEVNEHIDRIIDAYENHHLTIMDNELLSMIALREYTRGPAPDPEENKFEILEPKMSSHKPKTSRNSAAAQLGSKGGKVGGAARARKLSSQERSDIAKKGGQAKAANSKKKTK